MTLGVLSASRPDLGSASPFAPTRPDVSDYRAPPPVSHGVRFGPAAGSPPSRTPGTVLVLPAWYPTAAQPLSGPLRARPCPRGGRPGAPLSCPRRRGPPGRRARLLHASPRSGTASSASFGWLPALTGPGLRICSACSSVARRLAREGTPVDVLHAAYPSDGLAGGLAGRLLRRPVVITEHSSEWPRRLTDACGSPPGPGRLPAGCAGLPCQRASSACDRELRRARALPDRSQHRRRRVFHTPRQMQARPPTRSINVALHLEVKGLDVLAARVCESCRASRLTDARADRRGPANVRPSSSSQPSSGTERVRFVRTATPPRDRRSAARSRHFRAVQPEREHAARATGGALLRAPGGGDACRRRCGSGRAGDGALAPPGDAEALAARSRRFWTTTSVSTAPGSRCGLRRAGRSSRSVAPGTRSIARSMLTAPSRARNRVRNTERSRRDSPRRTPGPKRSCSRASQGRPWPDSGLKTRWQSERRAAQPEAVVGDCARTSAPGGAKPGHRRSTRTCTARTDGGASGRSSSRGSRNGAR